MSLRCAARRVVRLAGVAGGVGFLAVAFGQGPVRPASVTPAVDLPPLPLLPTSAKVVAANASVDGSAALPKAIADARSACAKLRDYTCHLVRQEVVNGKLLPEQVAELRVRTKPLSVHVRVIAPKAVAGQEAIYQSAESTSKVRFRAAREAGIRTGFVTLPTDDPKVLAGTSHPLPETGLMAVIDRMDKAVATEKQLNHPVQVLTAEYKFGGRAVTRYEVFADRPHPHRYAYRCVLYVDNETKLPARFEAYSQPKPGGPAEGELLEVQSFVGLKTNTGLGESAFER
ncbi:MAG TPA: DUF1571 domain-containing protein [Fimbriiglobus sp.]|nr:DUF1571 domain-containing protein [Fimbriiglobus sp.]